MATRVYGSSDALVFEGNLNASVPCTDEAVLVSFSDGTILEAGRDAGGIWSLSVLRKGSLFASQDENVVTFSSGELVAWVGRNAERVS